MVWGADPGPVRAAGEAVNPVSTWPALVAAEDTDAVVRLHSDRAVCSWAGESAELPATDEVEGMEEGLAWVAAWAGQVRAPIRTRVVWLVTWLLEVSPDNSCRRIHPACSEVPSEPSPADQAEPCPVRSGLTVRGL